MERMGMDRMQINGTGWTDESKRNDGAGLRGRNQVEASRFINWFTDKRMENKPVN